MMRRARNEELKEIYFMGFDVWSDGQSKEDYLKNCFASKKYLQGEWYVFQVNKRIVSSLITYKLNIGIYESAIGIGSIATVLEYRRQGFAQKLLQAVIVENETIKKIQAHFLFSDISPHFYEQLNFKVLPIKFQNCKTSICMMRSSNYDKIIGNPDFILPNYF